MTDIHGPGRIRTRNPSKRAVAHQRFRLRGHRNRRELTLFNNYQQSEISVIFLHVLIFKLGNVRKASLLFNVFRKPHDWIWGPPSLLFERPGWFLYPGKNPSRRAADHSSPSTAEIRNKWSHLYMLSRGGQGHFFRLTPYYKTHKTNLPTPAADFILFFSRTPVQNKFPYCTCLNT
jgi:hypothetical protein